MSRPIDLGSLGRLRDLAETAVALAPQPVWTAAAPAGDLRATLTAHVHQRVDALERGFRHNLAILGPSGSGKSHLVRAALGSLDGRFLKIVCALQPMTAQGFVRQFTVALLRAIVEDGQGLAPEALLERAAAIAPTTVEAIHQLGRTAGSHLHGEVALQALDLIPLAHRELQRPCVLVLDEFLCLGELGSAHLFHELGKRVVTWPYTVFVLTSSASAKAREILRERLHLLFGQFELVRLGPVEAAPAVAWMGQELSASAASAGPMRFLLQWAGHSVWSLQLLVRRMRELERLGGRSPRLEGVLTRGLWDTVGSPDGAIHQRLRARLERLDAVRHGSLAREALLAIARGARTTQAVAQQCQARRNLPQALELLVEEDLVTRSGGCWVMLDQVLRLWLTAVCDPVQAQGLPEPAQAGERVEAAARALVGDWLRAARQSLAERMGTLFAQFQNETVLLEHKTGRLPAFRMFRAAAASPSGGTSYLVADAPTHRWCCLIAELAIDDSVVSAFERFCQEQSPRPSRKVVVAPKGLDPNAKLLAKESNMWMWEPEDLRLLCLLYGQSLFDCG
jgi:hypothetical protein